jgi:Na+-transporting methylmalonyl-CoA/oxaloacetate decarboxylase beta subunit
MKNKKMDKVIIILTIICVIATVINLAYYYLLPMYFRFKFQSDLKGVNSIGIIGGSDGPTVIYLSNTKSHFLPGILVALSVIGITYIIIKRKKDHKDGLDS